MFARISTYILPPDRRHEAAGAFRVAADQLRRLEGLVDVCVLLNDDPGKAVAITFWDTAESMEASRLAATRARSEAARAVDAEIVSVEEFEVAVGEPRA